MRLAHPGQFRAVRQFHILAPEQLEVFAEQVIQDVGVHAAALVDDLIDFPLIPGFPEVRDKVVVIRIGHQAGKHPAAETLVLTGGEQVIGHEELIHRGRRFHKVGGRFRIIIGLRGIAVHFLSGVPEFVRDREDIRHALIPVQENEGVLAEDARAEAAGALANVSRKVNPALAVGAVHHLHIVFTEDGQAFADDLMRLLNGDLRIILRIQRDLEIGKGHFIEAVLFLQQPCVPAHMRSQALGDDIDLPVVHFARDLLAKEQRVKHIVKPAQLRQGLFLGHAGVVGGSRCVFILFQGVRKRAEGSPADRRIRVGLIVVFKERIAERILFSVHGKGIKGDVRELHGVVHGIGDIKHTAQRSHDFLRFRGEHMRFSREQVLQVHAAALC